MEENTTKVKAKASAKKKDKKLPWWIELFFVQIGLPEKLLVKFLNLEKNAKVHFQSNKSNYKLIGLIGVLMIYANPMIKESRQRNICVNITYESVKGKPENPIAKAEAINYCNGGNSLNILD